MSALALNGGSAGGPGRGGPAITLGRVLAIGAVALVGFVIWSLISAQIVTKRPNEMKTTQVVLPPPPPPPPPEPKPQEKPPEPTDAPPVEQPQDTPPPTPQPQQASPPSPGDDALTAREGAGPSNYGLAVGDGSGTRIGGRPGAAGGDPGFTAYAGAVRAAIQLATQADRELARGRYTGGVLVTLDESGRITDLRILQSTGDSRRGARLRRVLVGLQIARRPPPGLPPLRILLSSRPGA